MEVTERIKAITKAIRPEDRYPIFRYLQWYHIRDNLKQMVTEKGWYPDPDILAKATDQYVYYRGGSDPGKTYRENLEKVWKWAVDQKDELPHCGDEEQLRWLHATDEGCLLNVLRGISNEPIRSNEDGLLGQADRETLYQILLEPLVYEDMRSYLIRKRQKPNQKLVSDASRYYAYEMETDWDQAYWDSLWLAIMRVRKRRKEQEAENTGYELLTIPEADGTILSISCKIYSKDKDFSLVGAIKDAAKDYAAEHPDTVKPDTFCISDFLDQVPRRIQMDHGFQMETITKARAVRALAPDECLLGRWETQLTKQEAFDRITQYVYGQTTEMADEKRWEIIWTIRNFVSQVCFQEGTDVIGASALITAIEDYRKTWYPTTWLPFRVK